MVPPLGLKLFNYHSGGSFLDMKSIKIMSLKNLVYMGDKEFLNIMYIIHYMW